MALNNIQERIERSIFEAIRLVLVAEGYVPDITTFTNDQAGDASYQTALAAVKTAKDFAVEVFGHSSTEAKGTKHVPRIAIIPRRIMPGDIGKSISGGFHPNPLDPDSTSKLDPVDESSNLHIDINVVSGSAVQDRILHAVLAKAIGQRKFLTLYDDNTNRFFIRQFNFYDLPDDTNGIEEKVYSYEVPDIYLFEGVITDSVAMIKQITVETSLADLQAKFNAEGSLIGPFVGDGKIFIDLSGIKFQ